VTVFLFSRVFVRHKCKSLTFHQQNHMTTSCC